MEQTQSEIEKLSNDRIQRFQNLGKTFFEITDESKNSFFDSIREKTNYKFSQKDSKFNDFILPPRAIPLIFVYDSSLLKAYEYWLKNESAVNTASINVYNVAKDYYFRWAIAKDSVEKSKNRESLKEICEKNIDDRIFIICIFNALIDVSDNRINVQVPNLLLKLQRILNTINIPEDVKTKILYVINLLFGIYYIKSKDFNYAKVKFSESAECSSSGLISKFYLSLLELKTENYDAAFEYIKEIFYFDAERILKAIEYNELKQFLLYIRSAEFNNIFNENEFAPLVERIEVFIQEIQDKVKITAVLLDGILKKIKKMNLEEFYDDNTKRYFAFLDTVVIHFLTRNNFFFKISTQYLQQILNKCISQIISSINNNYDRVVEKKLEVYDIEMSDDYEEIVRLQNEIENDKTNYENVLSTAIQNLDREIIRTINNYKSALANIDKDEKYNTKRVFSNAMLYNTIISFIIIIIGGFVNLTTKPEVQQSTELADLTKSALASGFQWGGAVFFFGCIVSIIMVSMTVISKGNTRNNLIKKIRNQAQFKAEESEKIRAKKEKEFQQKIEKTNFKVEKYKKHIEQLREQKKREEIVLKESADLKIQEYQKELKDIQSAL